MQTITALLIIIIANVTKSNQKVNDKFEGPLPHFRLKMEEVFDEQVPESVPESTDNFVSFLVDNVKELFVAPDNSTMITTYGDGSIDYGSLLDVFRTSTDTMPSKILKANNSMITDYFHLPFFRIKNNIDNSKSKRSNKTDKGLLYVLKNIDTKVKKPENESLLKIKRNCIVCDNILNEDCSNPTDKLVPSIDCQREDDICYSQHTPFGIIDRGCFNLNHDVTLFVCACNLCNYISITEMPYIFSNKRDWVENVIELSRAKRFRGSIFKDMSCLKCEVNVSAKGGNMIADANCLEGDVITLPSQICSADEICGIKSIRSEGYMWRGCVSEPLYNYWWTFCDKDWCNSNTLISIYDT